MREPAVAAAVPAIKLRAEFGTAEFWAEYQAALASTPRTPAAPHEGTLAWLLERYRETTAWTYLSPATRRQRENIFLHVLATAGKRAIRQDHEGDHHGRPRSPC